MARTMRAVFWEGPGRVGMGERRVPTPGPGQALVEVLYNGLCSTDYPIVAGQVAGSWPGMVLGHEPVARILALGEGVTQPAVGQRVVLDTMLACGTCRACQAGHRELCVHSNEIGFTVDGTWTDTAVLPAANLYPLPDNVDDRVGTLLEALTCQIGAVNALDVRFGESAVIVGSGLAALVFVQLLRLKGAGHIAVVMRDYPERVDLARRFGADQIVAPGDRARLLEEARVQAGGGFDLAIDAVGSTETALAALAAVRRGGRVLLYGLRRATIDGFPLGETILRNLTLFGRTSAPWMWQPAIDLVARDQIKLRPMIGEIVELEEVPALLTRQEEHGGPLKRVIRVRGGYGS